MKKIIVYFSFLILCFGCEETHCPGFPSEYKKWLPYDIGQTLLFSSGNKRLSFQIDSLHFSEPWSYKWNCKCECDIGSAYMETSINKEYDIAVRQNVYFPGDTVFEFGFYSYKYWETSIENSYDDYHSDDFNFGKQTEYVAPPQHTGHLDIYKSFNMFKQLTVNQKSYSNVFVWEIDTIQYEDTRIWKLFFCENIGILKFFERQPNREWIRINN